MIKIDVCIGNVYKKLTEYMNIKHTYMYIYMHVYVNRGYIHTLTCMKGYTHMYIYTHIFMGVLIKIRSGHIYICIDIQKYKSKYVFI